MKWQTALEFARNQTDVTYDEWCGMYVDATPESEAHHRTQVEYALMIAHPILVRNRVIEESVVLTYTR